MKLAILAAATAGLLAADAPPAHPFFEKDEIHEIRIRFSQPDYWQTLVNNYAENEDDIPYLEASFEWRDVKFDKIGVRFKGNSSYRGARTDKKPFRLKFNEFVKGQKIQGIGSINLNNSWNDPSYVREKLYYEVATRAGMKAARTNYAALYINDKFIGIYLLCEIVNGDFLDTRFPAGERNGNLYKGDPTGTLEYRGDDKAAYKQMYEKKSNETDDNWDDIIQLSRVLTETPEADLVKELDKRMDIDSFLRVMALDLITVNLDNYIVMAHNYYLYRRPSDGLFEWIIWDPSLAYGAFPAGLSVQDMKTLPFLWTRQMQPGGGFPGGPGGGPGGPPPGGFPPGGFPPGGGFPGNGFASNARPLVTRLWAIPEIQKRYYAQFADLMIAAAAPSFAIDRMRELQTLLRPRIAEDPNKLNTLEEFEKSLIADQQLAGGGPQGQGPGGAAPGGPQGGFGNQSLPGLEALVRDRSEFVVKTLTELLNQ